MILDKKVEIILNGANFKHFKSLGYINLKSGDKIIIPIEHLNKGSHLNVNTKCDICGNVRQVVYKDYLNYIKKYNFYTCSKCSTIKVKKTNMKKYGVENVFQYQKTKDKIKQTNIIKYVFKKENVKKPKIIKSVQEIKDKIKKTNLIKYGVENVFQSQEIKDKIKKTNLIKYGVENVFQSQEIKDKIKKSNLIKYGVEYIMQNEKIKEKSKETSLKKYGVEHIMQSEFYFLKYQTERFLLKIHEITGLQYQGSYEKNFLDFCCENNIEIKKGKRFEYLINNKKHYYFSDFYYEYDNLIVEIKSDYTYNNDLDINLLKEKSAIDNGYKHIFIINKNYDKFRKIIKKYRGGQTEF